MSKLTRRSVVLAALCAGLLAALLTYLFLDREKARAAEMTDPVTVVVATRDIPARTVVEAGMVRETTRPVGTLPSNCANSVHEVTGRVTVAALSADQPVTRAAVAAQTAALGLAYVVPSGMRAVTVALDPIIGVAGFLKAGDHVDVLATFSVDKRSVTKTVLQDVELLAIGSEVRPEEVKSPESGKAGRPKEQPNATLSVTPAQAERLILAESQGKLRLALRRAGDERHVLVVGARSEEIIGIRPVSSAAAAPAPRVASSPAPAYSVTPPWLADSGPSLSTAKAEPEALSVETIRGTEKTTIKVRSE